MNDRKRKAKANKRVFKKYVDVFNKHAKRKKVSGANDNTFELLKAKYDKEIQEKERELEVLKAKRAHLIDFSHEATLLKNPELGISNKYRGWGMTEAALDAVDRWSPSQKPPFVTASQVKQYLLANGFTSDSNDLDIALAVTLKRLADSGRIATLETNGRRLYRAKHAPRGSTLRIKK